MEELLKKKILEMDDIKSIKPDLDKIKILKKELAEKIESLIFYGKWKKLYVLTTNNHTQLLTQVLDKIALNWYKFEFFYTDLESFTLAMMWYKQMEDLEEITRKEIEERKNASWIAAEKMIQTLYKNKSSYSEWDFIVEIIRLSFQSGASDLHFQPEEKWIVLRIRKDWILKEILNFDHKVFRRYLSKLKFMAGVRTNVENIPQDWRFDFVTERWWRKLKIDVRVSFMPWLRGESIVMRYLDWSKGIMSFSNIWFFDDNLEKLYSNLEKKTWLIFLTWPTWSWKTTTLYSMLNHLNDSSKKIITLEDPVEYELPWIQQSQINVWKWYTYEEWLKAILRQDPDIIMVWEIRNKETAEIAINASLTWHLVISTLHTNSSVEAISRLLNMWIKPYMLAPSLNMVIWQRLMRKLHDCSTIKETNTAEAEDIKHSLKRIKDANRNIKEKFDGKLKYSAWCEKCSNDWYLGRIAAVEVFDVNDDIKNMILKGENTLNIYSEARDHGYLTMKEDAYLKVLKWHTSLEELRRLF